MKSVLVIWIKSDIIKFLGYISSQNKRHHAFVTLLEKIGNDPILNLAKFRQVKCQSHSPA